MDLYIANTTKQNHVFIADIAGRGRTTRNIRAGQQIVLSGLSEQQADAIIKHHSRYGMRNRKDIGTYRDFVGLCYSDRPIQSEEIIDVVGHNDTFLDERSQQIREDAAVAAVHGAVEKTQTNINDLDLVIETRTLGEGGQQLDGVNQKVEVTANPEKLAEAERKGHKVLEPGRPGGSRARR